MAYGAEERQARTAIAEPIPQTAREVYFSWALREALEEEMERDSNVFLIGEDLAHYGGAFKVTKGLAERFGLERVIDTPISENSIVGLAVGAAMTGMRPVVEFMFMDFITLAMDQIVNHAAKFRYVYGEQCKVPITIRCPAGAGRAYGATHSQSLETWFVAVPGLKVVAPATPADAKGLLKSAIRDNNPVIFIESKLLYGLRGPVPEGEYLVPIGKGRVAREGTDFTLVSYSRMVCECEKAADMLAEQGYCGEVIDLRTLKPLDIELVASSVRKTGKVIVVEEDHKTGGVGAEVLCQIVEHAFEYLDAKPQRIASADVPIPCSSNLEQAMLPNAMKIAKAALEMLAQ